MTGIEKMVEILKAELAGAKEDWRTAYKDKDEAEKIFAGGKENAFMKMLEEARRLLAEEEAERPELAKHQPCGCIVCTCENEAQCQGCGAKHCGTHPIGEMPNPIYKTPQAPVGLVEELEELCEKWRKRWPHETHGQISDVQKVLSKYKGAKPAEEGLREWVVKNLKACRKNKRYHPNDKYWVGYEQALLGAATSIGIKCDKCHGEGLVGGGTEGLVYCDCDMGIIPRHTIPAKAEGRTK